MSILAGGATAQTCGGPYLIKRGDTLSGIAAAHYGNASMWTLIYSANRNLLGRDPDRIPHSVTLNLICIDGLPRSLPSEPSDQVFASRENTDQSADLTQAPVDENRRKIAVLTGSNFPPFTDKDLPGGGMLAEMVQAAMQAAAPDRGFDIHWVDDRTAHYDPLLSNALLDMGFPWFKPNCEADPTFYDCVNLTFSEPMFEMLTLLFVDKSRPFAFNGVADIAGKTLCRPAGYSTFIFDQDGRNWLRDGKIKLVTPTLVDTCFDFLIDGQVDAVVLNEFLGRKKIIDLGLKGRVDVALGMPLSIDSNHVVVHKSHPNAAELMELFDIGLNKIKADGTYQSIVDTHLTRVWQEF